MLQAWRHTFRQIGDAHTVQCTNVTKTLLSDIGVPKRENALKWENFTPISIEDSHSKHDDTRGRRRRPNAPEHALCINLCTSTDKGHKPIHRQLPRIRDQLRLLYHPLPTGWRDRLICSCPFLPESATIFRNDLRLLNSWCTWGTGCALVQCLRRVLNSIALWLSLLEAKINWYKSYLRMYTI